MGLLVLQPGQSTTLQDRGRFGYREWGVPVGGAFDPRSSDLANALLGNHPDCATLEMTLVGGTYRAETRLALALAGAPMSAVLRKVDGRERSLGIPGSFSLGVGERLQLGGTNLAARTYLAVAGGWQTPPLLGSRSSEVRLQAGITLAASSKETPGRTPAEVPTIDPCSRAFRFIVGPDELPEGDSALLSGTSYRVGLHSNRMGLRLEGPSLAPRDATTRLSMPVSPGALQLAGGCLLVLGVACGTMGGYPHVAHVITADLHRLGQLRPGDQVRFQRVSLEEARRLDRLAAEQHAGRLKILAALAGDASNVSTGD